LSGLLLLALTSPALGQGIITTIAGNGVGGYNGEGAPATSRELYEPFGVAVDRSGNVYIADGYNSRIRKLDTSGNISTVAGDGSQGYGGDNGPATGAELWSPRDVVVDKNGNLYIADTGNNRIRRVDTSGVISTMAGNGTKGYTGDGGPATKAELNTPNGIALDGSGNLYISERGNNVIRKVSVSGNISTVAGNVATGNPTYGGDGGPAVSAELYLPAGIAVDNGGNLYIADSGNRRVREVNTGSAPITVPGAVIPPGYIQTVAGSFATGTYSGDGGPATSAGLNLPVSLVLDSSGNLYIADRNNNVIRKVDTAGQISTVAGNVAKGNPVFGGDGGPATSAELWAPEGVADDSDGNLYIADTSNQRIRKVTLNCVQSDSADTTYTLSGVRFNDGGTASGTFSVTASGIIDSWNVTTTGGTIPNSNDYGALPASNYAGTSANPAIAGISPSYNGQYTLINFNVPVPPGTKCPTAFPGGGGLGPCSSGDLSLWVVGSLATTGTIPLNPGVDCTLGSSNADSCAIAGLGSYEMYLGTVNLGQTYITCPGPTGGNFSGNCAPYRLVVAGDLVVGGAGSTCGSSSVPRCQHVHDITFCPVHVVFTFCEEYPTICHLKCDTPDCRGPFLWQMNWSLLHGPLGDPELAQFSLKIPVASFEKARNLADDIQVSVISQTKTQAISQRTSAELIDENAPRHHEVVITGPLVDVTDRSSQLQSRVASANQIIELTLPFNAAGKEPGTRFRMVRFDQSKGQWVDVGAQSVTVSEGSVTARISALGRFTVVAEAPRH
jgi:sugar lactone lactonase YvrE